MELQELHSLEAQINKLIQFIHTLKTENQTLRAKLSSLRGKNDIPKVNHQETIQKIKSIIKQLKAEMV